MSLKCERAVLQDMHEFYDFINIARAERVASYLEIGSKHGGTLWYMGNTLPKGSRLVAVDLPQGDGSFKNSKPNLKECAAELKKRGYDMHLFIGDSRDATIIEAVKNLAPFDLCFIDANHTEPYVRADWANYGPLARLVAFHDIADDLERPADKLPIEVRKVWAELKADHKHREISRCAHQNGIGVLWNR